MQTITSKSFKENYEWIEKKVICENLPRRFRCGVGIKADCLKMDLDL